MFKMIPIKNLIIAGLLFSIVHVVQAGTPATFGDYDVHYNAFGSDTLQPSIAKAYDIVRSKNRGMVVISVIKKSPPPMGKPVRANIVLSANNLAGQLRELKVREIDDGSSIYYISEFHISHEEMLSFTLQVMPRGDDASHTVKYRQKFYTQ